MGKEGDETGTVYTMANDKKASKKVVVSEAVYNHIMAHATDNEDDVIEVEVREVTMETQDEREEFCISAGYHPSIYPLLERVVESSHPFAKPEIEEEEGDKGDKPSLEDIEYEEDTEEKIKMIVRRADICIPHDFGAILRPCRLFEVSLVLVSIRNTAIIL